MVSRKTTDRPSAGPATETVRSFPGMYTRRRHNPKRLPSRAIPRPFRRYLRAEAFLPSYPAPQSATPQQRCPDAASAHFQTATQDTNVEDQNARKPASNVHCCGVALSTLPAGAGERGIEEELWALVRSWARSRLPGSRSGWTVKESAFGFQS